MKKKKGKKEKVQNKTKKEIIIAVGLVILFIILTTEASTAAINVKYKDKILPGVSIGKINVGSMTREEARTTIQKEIDTIKQRGLTFCHEKTCTIIDALLIAPEDLDLAYSVIDTDVNTVVENAFSIGRSKNYLTRFVTQLNTLRDGNTIPVKWNINEEELIHTLEENFDGKVKKVKNAEIDINDLGEITLVESTAGETFMYENAILSAKKDLEKLNTPQVVLTVTKKLPDISLADIDVNETIDFVTHALNEQTWDIIYEDIRWNISKSDKKNLLTLQKENNTAYVGLDKEYFTSLVKGFSGVIEQPVSDAKFVMENGRVSEFQNSKDGITINTNAMFKDAKHRLQNNQTKETIQFPIIVDVVESKVKTADVNNLGITELIGIGHSNFAGSPVNRRHNIAIGARTLHGMLIAPGEEFSLIKALGEIDASQGYRQELVIKGNKTIPEYGGGLCQIGTTAFRVALDTGLPVTERRNHSYRVRYYEPAGTDATIYGPHPDFRFVNDTGNHILIQSRIEVDDIYFEFWGTNDGRIAEQTTPVVYNVTSPPPTKFIETTDLPVGEIKCTERAHNGADTSFDYTVTYVDGEEKKDTFKSHYRAWQEVCLKGVEKLSEIPDDSPKNDSENKEPTNSYN